MKRLAFLAAASLLTAFSPAFAADEFHFGRSRQPLVPRDDWGVLHTSKFFLNDTDFEPRESWRLFYYNKSRHVLMRDRAYMGALQEALQRNGYYCGPIDGYWSDEVSIAIAKLQKSYGYQVDGELTVSVRRAMRLP